MTIKDRIENDFSYHAPSEDGIRRMQHLRSLARQLAHNIAENVPAGREQSSALTKLEECIMHANAGIARNSGD